MTLTATIETREALQELVFGYAIRNRFGQDIYGINTFHTGDPIGPVDAGEQIKVRCRFPMNLGAGEYSITTAVVAGETHLDRNHEWCDLAKVFTVINAHKKAFTGFVWLEPRGGGRGSAVRAVVRRLKAIISSAVLGGEETNVSAAVPAADSVADAKAALREIEQELLRHQISAKWELMHRMERLQPPERQLTCALCGHTEPAEAFSVFESACIFEGGKISGTNARSVT